MSNMNKNLNTITVTPEKDLVASFVTKFSNELKLLIEGHPKEMVERGTGGL